MSGNFQQRGFTIIELMLSIAILAIVSALAVPLFGNNSLLQIDVARRVLISDIEYSQILAIANPEDEIALVFDEEGNGWHISTTDDLEVPFQDDNSAEPAVTILGQGSATSSPDVFVTTNMPDNAIIFNSNGGLLDFTQSASVTIQCGDTITQVVINPTTGSIQ
jgi:prepilin-type N-terminal cleavage/methylation domain-containing protein